MKLTITLAVLAAGIAAFGQLRHPGNPLTSNGQKIAVQHDPPFPECPPFCDKH
jgi:hypothetical protein